MSVEYLPGQRRLRELIFVHAATLSARGRRIRDAMRLASILLVRRRWA